MAPRTRTKASRVLWPPVATFEKTEASQPSDDAAQDTVARSRQTVTREAVADAVADATPLKKRPFLGESHGEDAWRDVVLE